MEYTLGTARTLGLAGTGLYDTERIGHDVDRRSARKSAAASLHRIAPEAEKHAVDGMRHVIAEDDEAAPGAPDASFLAGILGLKLGQPSSKLDGTRQVGDQPVELAFFVHCNPDAARARHPRPP